LGSKRPFKGNNLLDSLLIALEELRANDLLG